MAIIELKNVVKTYGDKKVLDNFSLKVEEGEMLAIMGSSGKGKTTILNIIGLLETFDKGELIIDGENNIKVNSSKVVKMLRSKISYLFQNFALVDEESVLYNLNLALKYVKEPRKIKKKLIKDALTEVRLPGIENKKVFSLSGGEQQRVAVARIILKPSKIILADEPTGSLDEKNMQRILNLLKSLNKKGKTVIIVTHDKKVSEQCSRVICI